MARSLLEKYSRCNARVGWSVAMSIALCACSESERDAALSADYSDAPGANPAPGQALPLSPARETCDDNYLLAGCQGIPGFEANVAADDAAAPPEVPQVSGDEYDAPGTNPFVMSDYDPLSTFAVDVDTASYDVFRRDVEDGVLPDPASVRLEEYVNYFAYDYPAADAAAEVPFSISLAAAPSPLDSELWLLRVGIQGKNPPPEEKRPANLVFLVDVSGSMNQSDKLPLAQQVLRQTLDLLEPTDTVSIVTYASDTGVRLAPTPVAQRDLIATEIAELASSGGTNGASGINLAYEQAEAAFIQGGINHVILCTDGDFNVGVSDNDALVDLIEQKRQTGVTFTALGFGSGNLNDAMLEAISNAGNGFYGVISSEGQAAEYVDERMLSTLSLIARDVKVQVEFNPQRVAAYRLLGYENRAIADDDFRDDVVDAGEIGAGHRVTALYELVLDGAELPSVDGAPAATTGPSFAGEREVGADDLVQVKLRYNHIDAGTQDAALEVAASLDPSGLGAASADLDLAWASAIAAFSEVLKQSPYASGVDLDALGVVFEAQSTRDDDRAEFYALFQQARALF
jgi:Ca-activated chloride channel family protein